MPHAITRLGRMKKIHFVGIGGAGMCGIAEVLINEGFEVSGSDAALNQNIERLKKLGATIYIGHDAKNIIDADVLVKSTGIPADNIEILVAQAKHIPVIKRAQMLGELMRGRYGIAISGTHGKTTTTSLAASVLTEGGLDPTFVIGGLLNSAGSNAKLGTSEYLIAEADESDASFLTLQPIITVVTNIDADHMETYGNNFETLRQTFIKFLDNLPFYGLAILCLDDPVIKRSLSEIGRRQCTYGFDPQADVAIIEDSCRYDGWHSHFVVKRRHGTDLTVTLKLPGRHNILNAAAVIAIAQELAIPDAALLHALAQFSGVGRRLQNHGTWSFSAKEESVAVLDDYGHHPREIAVTLDALKNAYPQKRIVMVFQPHRYTRTRDLFADFASVLSTCDELCLLDVYSAGEEPIAGATSQCLAEAIKTYGNVKPVAIRHVSELPEVLSGLVQEGDLLLFQGAGNVGGLADKLIRGVL